MTDNEIVESTPTNKLEIANLRYTKDWTNPSDFPTYEPNETQVRADMQYLFNEIKTWLNETLIPAVQSAAEMGGATGEAGSVADVYINAAGHLIIKMSDGTETDLGLIAGGPGWDGEPYVKSLAVSEEGHLLVNMSDKSVNDMGAIVALKPYVVKLAVSEEGHLIVTMSDGTEVDLGVLGGDATTIITQNLITQNLYADNGDIARLTVDSFSTSRRVVRYLAGDTSDDNYIIGEDQHLRFMTGTVTGGTVQHTDRFGRLLYWEQSIAGATLNDLGYPEIEGKQVTITTEPTEWPVIVYEYNDLCKLEWAFSDIPGDDTTYYVPTIILGAGDQQGNAKGYIYKLTDALRIDYQKTDGTVIAISLSDAGVKVLGTGETAGLRNVITVPASTFDAAATYGSAGDIVAVIED